ncbi:ANTAR domain-containing protein [Acutalibacter sp. 1XD8-33]|uniref:ANTAR domain-containing response regulator n=1 Tax=Acutalibacter sp. 1XD8-33 TaxID=2320081 RepID=UPI000EA39B42|nr:ANTAR domain-containing protein [Acutalibacter sp. 1XD8-33]RKJ41379.1 ANTAR domain-containing protein [Acutalibacter sp. 1XD8-33]
MELRERQYSLLAVSKAEKFNMALESLLPSPGFCQTQFAGDLGSARRILAERPFDFVLVNSPLPDGSGVGFAVDACESQGTVALLIVRAEIHEEVYAKVVGHGVFTLSRPTSRQAVSQAVRWMASARERLRKLEKRSLTLEEKMAEIRLVNRAKWLLINQEGMEEPQAHRFIEKRAMDLGLTKGQVAREIIGGQGEEPE